MLFGVDVIIIGPGAIDTPIWGKGDGVAEDARYAASPYKASMDKIRKYFANAGAKGLPAEDVGALVWRVLTIAKPRARYAIMRRARFRMESCRVCCPSAPWTRSWPSAWG